MKNDGSVPQYYVEDSHPAIIDPDQFQLVQDIFKERASDELADRINQIMIRRRKLERFIETVEGLPELYTEFDAGQWAALVDSMTVHAKDRITFTLTCGMEIEE